MFDSVILKCQVLEHQLATYMGVVLVLTVLSFYGPAAIFDFQKAHQALNMYMPSCSHVHTTRTPQSTGQDSDGHSLDSMTLK